MPKGTEKANFRLSIAPTLYGEKAVVRVVESTAKRSRLTRDNPLPSQRILEASSPADEKSHRHHVRLRSERLGPDDHS